MREIGRNALLGVPCKGKVLQKGSTEDSAAEGNPAEEPAGLYAGFLYRRQHAITNVEGQACLKILLKLRE